MLVPTTCRRRLPARSQCAVLADLIVIGILPKLAAHGRGIGGYCRSGQRLFSVSMPVLESGAGSKKVFRR
jgi:hypothetical protein